jgi:hypothetical protein
MRPTETSPERSGNRTFDPSVESAIAPITLGGSVSESATISPVNRAVTIPPFPPIGGSITYAVSGPLPATIGAGPNCTPSAVGDTTLGSATVTNGADGASQSFTPTRTRTYCFVGHYSGDSNYQGFSHSRSGECFLAKPAPAILVGTVALDGTVSIHQNATAPVTIELQVAQDGLITGVNRWIRA